MFAEFKYVLDSSLALWLWGNFIKQYTFTYITDSKLAELS
jgi:hypothetical protein